MASEAPVKVYEVSLRDLESLLRKRLGDGLVLLDYWTESLLPPGENYGSTILKVHARVRRDAGRAEDLHLVAKMLPATDFQRRMFDSGFTFKKERFLYEDLLPAYQQLELALGVAADRVFDILPEFFGARYSLTSGGGDREVDDDAVILMRNLKQMGYYMADRRNGMDLEHGKAVLSALARFHGLGIAMKHHRADFFEVVKERAKCLNFEGESFEEAVTLILKTFREDPVTSRHYDKLEPALKQDMSIWSAPPTEPWATIIHADFWINNIMFRKEEGSERVADVKFVDFQNYLFMSPLRELVFFLTTSIRAEVMDGKFEELLDFYYGQFVGTLERMACDTRAFARDKFDARLKIDGFEEFPHCPFMLKIMTSDAKEDSGDGDIKERMMDMTMNELCRERLRRCVNKFVEKGWLG